MKKICIFTTIILDFGKKYSERQYVPIDNKFAYRTTHKLASYVKLKFEASPSTR